MMRMGFTVLALLVIGGLFLAAAAADESPLTTECSKDFQSVMTCLSFAQGKVATPTTECCSSVSGIKENKPKCLCYILQQTQTSGAQNLKSLGVQEAKLFELPSACHLKNASVSDCPKLLGLPPNSPDAAIFANSSSKATTTPSTPAASTGTPSSAAEKSESKSGGTKLGAGFVGWTAALLVATAAVFLFAFPAEFD
ncbi:glycosylphosphatidylinositol-anchored lipid protein transfer 1 [Hibiscus trionum]|uniref:Glycosylphosphatidylinositol-anchored lipid protein transfer 1 n=1 Tax=Hibiscus trionum TaxID=183268 RepID=A0A9W7IWM8_HIBTR|nr:glycosylphosphatidylinositol-anchored lipid protein transfer 1 [Hibiscus trionum]